MRARAFAFALLVTTRASADVAVSALAGYGVPYVAPRTSSERAGAGVRAGVEAHHVWIGALAMTHHGSAIVAPGFSYRASDVYVGPEVGYVARVGSLLIVPFVGAGVLGARERTRVGRAEASDSGAHGYVAPGIVAMYDFGRWLAGVDAHAPLVVSRPAYAWALGVFATVGVHFGR